MSYTGRMVYLEELFFLELIHVYTLIYEYTNSQRTHMSTSKRLRLSRHILRLTNSLQNNIAKSCNKFRKMQSPAPSQELSLQQEA